MRNEELRRVLFAKYFYSDQITDDPWGPHTKFLIKKRVPVSDNKSLLGATQNI